MLPWGPDPLPLGAPVSLIREWDSMMLSRPPVFCRPLALPFVSPLPVRARLGAAQGGAARVRSGGRAETDRGSPRGGWTTGGGLLRPHRLLGRPPVQAVPFPAFGPCLGPWPFPLLFVRAQLPPPRRRTPPVSPASFFSSLLAQLLPAPSEGRAPARPPLRYWSTMPSRIPPAAGDSCFALRVRI